MNRFRRLFRLFFKAVLPDEQVIRLRSWGIYRMRVGHHLRIWWRIELKRAFCRHERYETYVDWGWTAAYVKCKRCTVILKDISRECGYKREEVKS